MQRSTDRLTYASFAGAVAVWALALFLTPILPSVDYPQHLALAAMLRRFTDANSPERRLFETNLVSYNGGFHVLTVALSFVLPIEIAGKVVLAAIGIGLAVAWTRIVVLTERPASRVFAVLPLLGGYWFAWGFVNFGAGLAIGLFLVGRMLAPAETRRARVVDAALALLACWAHLLAAAVCFLFCGIVALGRSSGDVRQRLSTTLRLLSPLGLAVAYGAIVYLRQERSAYRNYEYARLEGLRPTVLAKIEGFGGFAAGLRTDRVDALLVWAVVLLTSLAFLLRDRDDRPTIDRLALLATSVTLFIALPHTFWATNFVYQRFAMLVVLFGVAAAPRARPPFERAIGGGFVAIGVLGALLFVASMRRAARELADLDRFLHSAPPSLKVIGLIYQPGLSSFEPPILLHAPALYVARRGGESAFAFTRTMSLPLHYRFSEVPPSLPFNFEWSPWVYRADAAYARRFGVIFLKAPQPNVRPEKLLGRAGITSAAMLAHVGPYWLLRVDDIR